jgi:hypothetical protein
MLNDHRDLIEVNEGKVAKQEILQLRRSWNEEDGDLISPKSYGFWHPVVIGGSWTVLWRPLINSGELPCQLSSAEMSADNLSVELTVNISMEAIEPRWLQNSENKGYAQAPE